MLPYLLYTLTIASHLAINYFFKVNSSLKEIIVFDLFLFGLFVLGTFACIQMKRKSNEKFVMAFLVSTTIQLLSAFSIIAALVYLKTPNAKQIGIESSIVFCILLFIQSVTLIRKMNHQ